MLPRAVSKRIAESLGQEFEAQAALEVAAGLTVSVMQASTALAKANMASAACDPRSL